MTDELGRGDEEIVQDEIPIQPEFPVQSELEWAAEYRAWQDYQTRVVSPKHSPIDVPFIVCRAREMARAAAAKRCPCPHKKKHASSQPTLLDRSALTQSQYMDILSAPHKFNATPTCKKKHKKKCPCKCRLAPCPPRLVQMAVPSKRLVYYTWRDHQNTLPADAIIRFDKILSGNNEGLEPSEARYYFKQLARKERRERRKKRAAKKRRCRIRRGLIKDFGTKWHDLEADYMADAICDYIVKEPLFALNYNQMMLSNEIVKYFHLRKKCIPKRTTKNMRHRTLMEFADKVAKWLDGMAHFIDMQPLDISELEALMRAPSLEDLLLEEEGEEELSEAEMSYEGTSEYEYEREREGEEGIGVGELGEGVYGEDGALITDDGELGIDLDELLFGSEGGDEEFEAEKIVDRIDEYGEESMVDVTVPGMQSYIDMLERLIAILSNSDDEFLDSLVNLPGTDPNLTYREVLEKLKLLRDGALDTTAVDANPLEETMREWAIKNEPEQVDEPIKETIHETSQILMEYFRKTPKNKDKDGTGGTDGLGGTGEDGELTEEERTIREAREREGEDGELTEEDKTIREAREREGEDGELTEEEKERRRATGEGEDGELTEEEKERRRATGEGEDGELTEEEKAIREAREREGEDGELTEEEKERRRAAGEGEGEEGGLTEEEKAILEATRRELEEGEAAGEGEGDEFWRRGEEDEYSGEEEWGMEELIDEATEHAIDKVTGGEGGEIPGPDYEGLDELLRIIRGHKPSVVYDHAPGTICCLSLKIWAIWLLEIAQNAHNWTRWIADIIKQVRYYAATIRGDVTLPNGKKKVLYKEEWRRFTRETEEKIIAWRQYSKHVKDLSNEIIETFHGKKVACCPKCLQDHMIKNVVTAHETLEALTEAINCAAYWQRCLDKIVEQTSQLTGIDLNETEVETESSESIGSVDFEELSCMPRRRAPRPPSSDSGSSLYEIEELDNCFCPPRR